MTRILASIGSLAILLALVPGGAWVLIHWGRLDLVGNLGRTSLSTRSGGSALMLTLVGWGAWAMLTASVINQILTSAGRGRFRWNPPGSALFGPSAAVLVTCVAGLAATSSGTSEDSGDTPTGSGSDVAATSATPDPGTTRTVPAARTGWHTVADGDDLWSLAERYYGDGSRWREIVAANETSVLSPVEPLVPGSLLEIPGIGQGGPGPDASRAGSSGARLLDAVVGAPESETPEEPATREARQDQAVVRSGDTLWGLAREHLGEGAEWPRIQHANADVITDPHTIVPGQRLVIPAVPETAAPPVASSGPAPGDRIAAGGAGVPADPPAATGSADVVEHEQESAAAAQRVAPAPSVAGDAASPPDAAGADRDPAGPGALETDQDVSAHVGLLIGPMGAVVAGAFLAVLTVRRRWQRTNRPPGTRIPTMGDRGAEMLSAMAAAAAGGPGLGEPVDKEPDRPGGPSGDSSQEGSAALPVRLGESSQGPVTLDLLGGGLYTIQADDEELRAGLLASVAVQLAAGGYCPVSVHLPTSCAWLARLDNPELYPSSDDQELHQRLTRLVDDRTERLDDSATVAAMRADPDQADAWAPAVFLLDGPCCHGSAQLARLGIAVLSPPSESRQADITLDEGAGWLGELEFVPELVSPPARRGLEVLLEAAGGTEYDPAWWWNPEPGSSDSVIPLPLQPSPPSSEEFIVPESPPSPAPFLRMLGPIELVNARGPQPSRAVKQCEEYCAWILAHPGSSAARMTRDLLVADTTRRSNMSRLRAWLGQDPEGEPYLPDAYTGRITLHPAVTSDWEQLQILVAGGVNRASDHALQAGLSLLRGAPLADAAPGEWRWAEELRSDMVCTMRDIGVTLAGHCLLRRDLEGARWATSRALAAAPDDELLMRLCLRTEHLAGDRREVERLVLQITRHARLLGTDLMDDTVALLQEVMEGQARARLA